MRRDEIDAYLATQRNATLASVGVDGLPHQVAMWFLPETDRIVMWTFRRSQKAVNLRRNPSASFMVQDGDSYNELRGVAVRGKVELIDDTAGIGASDVHQTTLQTTCSCWLYRVCAPSPVSAGG